MLYNSQLPNPLNTTGITIIAVNIGPNMDNYAIQADYSANVETNTLHTNYKLIKSPEKEDRIPSQQYPRGYKFREVLVSGRLEDCYQMMTEILEDTSDEVFQL